MRTRSPFLSFVAEYMLIRQYSLRSVDTYLKSVAAYIHFHDKRHPTSMGDREVELFLDDLILTKKPLLELKLRR